MLYPLLLPSGLPLQFRLLMLLKHNHTRIECSNIQVILQGCKQIYCILFTICTIKFGNKFRWLGLNLSFLPFELWHFHFVEYQLNSAVFLDWNWFDVSADWNVNVLSGIWFLLTMFRRNNDFVLSLIRAVGIGSAKMVSINYVRYLIAK